MKQHLVFNKKTDFLTKTQIGWFWFFNKQLSMVRVMSMRAYWMNVWMELLKDTSHGVKGNLKRKLKLNWKGLLKNPPAGHVQEFQNTCNGTPKRKFTRSLERNRGWPFDRVNLKGLFKWISNGTINRKLKGTV